MKLIRTYGKTAAEAEKILRQIEGRSDAATGRLEPEVKRILADIRRKGDDALRRYAERLDGLASSADMRVTEAEMKAAWEQTPGELRKSMQAAAGNIRRFARWQMPKEWTRKLRWRSAWSARSATRICWLLCSRRPLSAALNLADDGDSSSSRRGETYRRRLSASSPRNSGRGASGRASRSCIASAARRQLPLWPTVPPACRASIKLSGPEISMSPLRRSWSRLNAASTCWPAQLKLLSPVRMEIRSGLPPTSLPRPSMILKRSPSLSPAIRNWRKKPRKKCRSRLPQTRLPARRSRGTGSSS